MTERDRAVRGCAPGGPVSACRKGDKKDDRGCHGAPDWVIEIVSPSSKRMDYYTKLAEYKEAGVREYWIVDPYKKYVVVYDLEHEEAPLFCPLNGCMKAGIYEDLEIDFSEMKL